MLLRRLSSRNGPAPTGARSNAARSRAVMASCGGNAHVAGSASIDGKSLTGRDSRTTRVRGPVARTPASVPEPDAQAAYPDTGSSTAAFGDATRGLHRSVQSAAKVAAVTAPAPPGNVTFGRRRNV